MEHRRRHGPVRVFSQVQVLLRFSTYTDTEEKPVKILSAVVFTLLMSGFAQAQTQPSKSAPAQTPAPSQATPGAGSSAAAGTPAVDPAKAADIRRLLDVVGTQAMMSQTLSATLQNMRPMLANSLPPGDYREKLIDLFLEKFTARANAEFPKLSEAAIPIYDKYLSGDDVKGLIQFYQTPLGQKTLSVIPKVAAEMQLQGQKLGETIGRECMMQVISEHPELAPAMQDAQSSRTH
jgi:hypothetical protein